MTSGGRNHLERDQSLVAAKEASRSEAKRRWGSASEEAGRRERVQISASGQANRSEQGRGLADGQSLAGGRPGKRPAGLRMRRESLFARKAGSHGGSERIAAERKKDGRKGASSAAQRKAEMRFAEGCGRSKRGSTSRESALIESSDRRSNRKVSGRRLARALRRSGHSKAEAERVLTRARSLAQSQAGSPSFAARAAAARNSVAAGRARRAEDGRGDRRGNRNPEFEIVEEGMWQTHLARTS